MLPRGSFTWKRTLSDQDLTHFLRVKKHRLVGRQVVGPMAAVSGMPSSPNMPTESTLAPANSCQPVNQTPLFTDQAIGGLEAPSALMQTPMSTSEGPKEDFHYDFLLEGLLTEWRTRRDNLFNPPPQGKPSNRSFFPQQYKHIKYWTWPFLGIVALTSSLPLARTTQPPLLSPVQPFSVEIDPTSFDLEMTSDVSMVETLAYNPSEPTSQTNSLFDQTLSLGLATNEVNVSNHSAQLQHPMADFDYSKMILDLLVKKTHCQSFAAKCGYVANLVFTASESESYLPKPSLDMSEPPVRDVPNSLEMVDLKDVVYSRGFLIPIMCNKENWGHPINPVLARHAEKKLVYDYLHQLLSTEADGMRHHRRSIEFSSRHLDNKRRLETSLKELSLLKQSATSGKPHKLKIKSKPWKTLSTKDWLKGLILNTESVASSLVGPTQHSDKHKAPHTVSLHAQDWATFPDQFTRISKKPETQPETDTASFLKPLVDPQNKLENVIALSKTPPVQQLVQDLAPEVPVLSNYLSESLAKWLTNWSLLYSTTEGVINDATFTAQFNPKPKQIGLSKKSRPYLRQTTPADCLSSQDSLANSTFPEQRFYASLTYRQVNGLTNVVPVLSTDTKRMLERTQGPLRFNYWSLKERKREKAAYPTVGSVLKTFVFRSPSYMEDPYFREKRDQVRRRRSIRYTRVGLAVKKRKRIYPRPHWLRNVLYTPFLKLRHPGSPSTGKTRELSITSQKVAQTHSKLRLQNSLNLQYFTSEFPSLFRQKGLPHSLMTNLPQLVDRKLYRVAKWAEPKSKLTGWRAFLMANEFAPYTEQLNANFKKLQSETLGARLDNKIQDLPQWFWNGNMANFEALRFKQGLIPSPIGQVNSEVTRAHLLLDELKRVAAQNKVIYTRLNRAIELHRDKMGFMSAKRAELTKVQRTRDLNWKTKIWPDKGLNVAFSPASQVESQWILKQSHLLRDPNVTDIHTLWQTGKVRKLTTPFRESKQKSVFRLRLPFVKPDKIHPVTVNRSWKKVNVMDTKLNAFGLVNKRAQFYPRQLKLRFQKDKELASLQSKTLNPQYLEIQKNINHSVQFWWGETENNMLAFINPAGRQPWNIFEAFMSTAQLTSESQGTTIQLVNGSLILLHLALLSFLIQLPEVRTFLKFYCLVFNRFATGYLWLAGMCYHLARECVYEIKFAWYCGRMLMFPSRRPYPSFLTYRMLAKQVFLVEANTNLKGQIVQRDLKTYQKELPKVVYYNANYNEYFMHFCRQRFKILVLREVKRMARLKIQAQLDRDEEERKRKEDAKKSEQQRQREEAQRQRLAKIREKIELLYLKEARRKARVNLAQKLARKAREQDASKVARDMLDEIRYAAPMRDVEEKRKALDAIVDLEPTPLALAAMEETSTEESSSVEDNGSSGEKENGSGQTSPSEEGTTSQSDTEGEETPKETDQNKEDNNIKENSYRSDDSSDSSGDDTAQNLLLDNDPASKQPRKEVFSEDYARYMRGAARASKWHVRRTQRDVLTGTRDTFYTLWPDASREVASTDPLSIHLENVTHDSLALTYGLLYTQERTKLMQKAVPDLLPSSSVSLMYKEALYQRESIVNALRYAGDVVLGKFAQALVGLYFLVYRKSYRVYSTVDMTIERTRRLALQFFEEPGEYAMKALNDYFLVAFMSDLLTSKPDEAETLETIRVEFYTRQFNAFGPLGALVQRRLHRLYDDFYIAWTKPDLDLFMRHQKSLIFWNMWGALLIRAVARYKLSLADLLSTKEEQEKLVECLITESDWSWTQQSLIQFQPLFDLFSLGKRTWKDFTGSTISKQLGDPMSLQDLLYPETDARGKSTKSLTQLETAQKLNPADMLYADSHAMSMDELSWRWGAQQMNMYHSRLSLLSVEYQPAGNLQAVPQLKYYDTTHTQLGWVIQDNLRTTFKNTPSKNALIIGPPGPEVTSLIRAMVGELEMKLITDNARRYTTVIKNVAIGVRHLKEVFYSVSVEAPCLFVLEDIHLIGRRRELLIAEDEELYLLQPDQVSAVNEPYEENFSIGKLDRHMLFDYEKPFRGDYSFLLSTNCFAFDYFFEPAPSRLRRFGLFTKSPYKLKAIEQELVKLRGLENLSNAQSKAPSLSLTSTVDARKPVKEVKAAPNSPLTVAIEKNKKAFRPRRTVKNMPLQGISWDMWMLLSRYDYSIRSKVALLAVLTDDAVGELTDMITDLLVMMDTVRATRGLIMFATTHSPTALDPALRRPGRLDETLTVPLFSSASTRWEILNLRFEDYDPLQELMPYAVVTHNFSNYEVSELVLKSTLNILPKKVSFGHTAEPAATPIGAFKSHMHMSYFEAFMNSKGFKDLKAQLPNTVEASAENQVSDLPTRQRKFKAKVNTLTYTLVGAHLIRWKAKVITEDMEGPLTYSIEKVNPMLARLERQHESAQFTVARMRDPLTVREHVTNSLAPRFAETFFTSSLLNPRYTLGPDKELYGSQLIFQLREKTNYVPLTFQKFELAAAHFKPGGASPFTSFFPAFRNNLITLGVPASRTSDFISSVIQKRAIWTKNLVVYRLLYIPTNQDYREPQGLPTYDVLDPYKNFETLQKEQRVLYRPGNLTMNEKIEIHKTYRLYLALANRTIDIWQGGEELRLLKRHVLPSLEELNSLALVMNHPSGTNKFYRNMTLRQRFHLIDQWWNAQLDDYDTETTLLSDVETRTFFEESMGEDVDIEYPQPERYYNVRSRRWVWKQTAESWFMKGAKYTEAAAYHYMVCALTRCYEELHANRESLDHLAYTFLKSGDLSELETFSHYTRFYQSDV
jgi:SpoVK/Ycf46/Vps4 family AAA+-type ATPase